MLSYKNAQNNHSTANETCPKLEQNLTRPPSLTRLCLHQSSASIEESTDEGSSIDQHGQMDKSGSGDDEDDVETKIKNQEQESKWWQIPSRKDEAAQPIDFEIDYFGEDIDESSFMEYQYGYVNSAQVTYLVLSMFNSIYIFFNSLFSTKQISIPHHFSMQHHN